MATQNKEEKTSKKITIGGIFTFICAVYLLLRVTGVL